MPGFDAVWITWETQRRNRSMAAGLGVPLWEIDLQRPRFARYVASACETVKRLRRVRPSVVFAQSPSAVLCLLLIALRRPLAFTLVIDAHFAGVEANGGSQLLQAVLDFCNRQADFVVVTNEGHRRQIARVGGRALICEDPLPEAELAPAAAEPRGRSVFVISSFGDDEPYQVVLEAARLLAPEGFEIAISGDYRKRGIEPSRSPHVEFLGFVPDDQYRERLAGSSVIVDFTTRESCLVCGAYEAIAVERPLVLSDTRALRGYFTHGTVFTAPRAQSVAEAIRHAYENRSRLTQEIRDWRPIARAAIARRLDAIKQLAKTPGAAVGSNGVRS